MSNLLKSKPDDLTPQGSNPTTIVQKIIEICQSGSKSSRTGTELTSIKEHQNSVFTYKGQPATYVSGADGKFTFAVIDISGASPVMHTYSVDGMKNITQGEDVAFDSELPSVSSTDNGKVLKVVSGEWAKADESGGGGAGYDVKLTCESDKSLYETSITLSDFAVEINGTIDDLADTFESKGILDLVGNIHYKEELENDGVVLATIDRYFLLKQAVDQQVAYSSIMPQLLPELATSLGITITDTPASDKPVIVFKTGDVADNKFTINILMFENTDGEFKFGTSYTST